MISFFYKYRKTIFTVTVVVFIVSLFFGLGAYIGNISFGEVVAKIGSRRVSYKDYQRMFSIAIDNVMRDKKDLNGEEAYKIIEKMVKDEVFKELVVEEILSMEAEKFDFKVSDFEVAMEIQNTSAFIHDGRFDPSAYVSTIWSKYRMTPSEYEEWRRKARLVSKFKSFLLETVKVSPDEVAFYREILKDTKIKDDKQFAMALKQQKFMDVANGYLRNVVSRIEVKDFRSKFERNL